MKEKFLIRPFYEENGVVNGKNVYFVFDGDRAAIAGNGEIAGMAKMLSFGMIGDRPCIALEKCDPLKIAETLEFFPVRQLCTMLGEVECTALLRAKALLFWRKRHRFCGVCGHLMSDHETEAGRVCKSCGNLEFPMIAPAVIVAITDAENRLLLAHNAKFRNDVHSLIAGFVEAGENLEQAIVREVAEEVGIQVDNVRYFASQSWPFPGSLMLGFTAKYHAGEIVPDGAEITHAAFYDAEHVPEIPAPGSIARRMIDCWKKGEWQ